MTTAKTPSTLDEAIAQLRAAGEPDLRAAAVLAWAQSRDREKLKTLAAVYRNAEDEALRRIARAANEFVAKDTRSPFYDDGPLQLNMATSTYMLGDRVKALDYLTRAVSFRPDWRDHPVIADFAATLMGLPPEEAAALLASPTSEMAFNVARGAGWWQQRALAVGNVNWRTSARNLLFFGIAMGLLIGLTIHIAAQLWLPQARLVRAGPFADLLTSLLPYARWTTGSGTLVVIASGLLAVVDVLIRGGALYLLAVLAVESRERIFLALFYRLIIFQTLFAILALGALCAILVLSAMSLVEIRNSTVAAATLAQTFVQLRVWLIASSVGYAVFLARLLADTFRTGVWRGLFIALVMMILVAVAESLLARGLLALTLR